MRSPGLLSIAGGASDIKTNLIFHLNQPLKLNFELLVGEFVMRSGKFASDGGTKPSCGVMMGWRRAAVKQRSSFVCVLGGRPLTLSAGVSDRAFMGEARRACGAGLERDRCCMGNAPGESVAL